MATNDPTTGSPPIIARGLSIDEWLQYVANYDFGSIPPDRVVVHHTYIPTVAQWQGLSSLRGIQRYYAGLGWKAGPHLFVGPDKIWLFTPMKDIGIHAGIGNSGYRNGKLWYSIGVEIVGNYDQVRPSGSIWEHSKAVFGGLSRRLGIAPKQLFSFHRDYTNEKSCPGWAITKEWVNAEVEAWLNQETAPPVAVGSVGSPSPSEEALADVLLRQSYAQRSEGYNDAWAFHQIAIKQNLGAPIGKNTTIRFADKEYSFQVFARDTLYCEVPNWGEVSSLNELVQGQIPAEGLGRVLLEASYKAGGSELHDDWSFHRYAVANKLGPALAASARVTLGNASYSYQVFALDTLFNLVPQWDAVQRLSDLADNGQQAELRQRLLQQTYQDLGLAYHADWAFHQIAYREKLGAPLSDSYRISQGVAQYSLQVYAGDTLYNVVPNWGEVFRLSTLIGPRAVVLGDEIERMPRIPSTPPPSDGQFRVVQYAAPEAKLTAYSPRHGSAIHLLVLHSDPGPAEQNLAYMASPSARSSTNFYLDHHGTIYQLIDPDLAAWHAGMAEWNGRRQNINRISIGITLEHQENYSQRQLQALAWLVEQLKQRYGLDDLALVGWSQLSGGQADPVQFPWDSWQNPATAD
jgi:N-acetyl-anhydromuramyl-L-alanine amidase AmpD